MRSFNRSFIYHCYIRIGAQFRKIRLLYRTLYQFAFAINSLRVTCMYLCFPSYASLAKSIGKICSIRFIYNYSGAFSNQAHNMLNQHRPNMHTRIHQRIRSNHKYFIFTAAWCLQRSTCIPKLFKCISVK